MDEWRGEIYEELGCGYVENKSTREGWLEKVFRESQEQQSVVESIIIIIIIIIK
jgi:hypothetical protein